MTILILQILRMFRMYLKPLWLSKKPFLNDLEHSNEIL